MLYRFAFVLICFVPAVLLQAQRGPGAGGPKGQAYGRLVDESRKPVPFASASVLLGDSVVGGALVQENGDFDVPNLPMGSLRLRVVAMGYAPLEQEFTLSRENPVRDLGNLVVAADAVVLQAAEIARERATQVLQVDRRVYNVEKDISVVGGDATDVMKNIPGLSVDVDGNVEMRGRSPRVFVDGRPSTLSLDQIPAADIERVEVITNPSVIFDASATGGIVNVVMKRTVRPGYSGQIQLGLGTDERYNVNGSLQMRQGRSSFNLSLGLGQSSPIGHGYGRRTDLADGQPSGYFLQDSERTNERQRQNARLSWDYKLNVRNTLSITQGVYGGRRNSLEDQTFRSLDAGREPIGSGSQHNRSEGSNFSTTTRVGFMRTTTKPGKEWSTDLTFDLSDRTNPSTTEQFSQGDDVILPGRIFQSRDSKGAEQEWTWQADVSDAYADNRKLQWGFKANYERNRSSMDVSYVNDTLPGLVQDSLLSNAYLISTFVNAAYVNWSTTLTPHWSLQTGLRVEQNSMHAERTDQGNSFSYNYPDGLDDLGRVLFPALYLSHKWEAPEGELQRELQVNISRKVNRPRHFQMMPFIMSTDARSYRIGNPLLLPEMSTILEVNHMLPLGGKGNWLSSLYGRFTADVITSYTAPLPADPNVLLSTYVNGDHNQGFGWENTVKLTLWQGLEATFNGNIQWVEIGLSQGGNPFSNTGFNFDGKVNLAQKLPKGFTMQVNADYDGPRVIPQGHTLERYSMDISARKEVNKNLSITASANNIFDSRGWGSFAETPYFTQENYQSWGNRSFRISATWRFGKADAPLFRKRPAPVERRIPGTGGGDEGGGE